MTKDTPPQAETPPDALRVPPLQWRAVHDDDPPEQVDVLAVCEEKLSTFKRRPS